MILIDGDDYVGHAVNVAVASAHQRNHDESWLRPTMSPTSTPISLRSQPANSTSRVSSSRLMSSQSDAEVRSPDRDDWTDFERALRKCSMRSSPVTL